MFTPYFLIRAMQIVTVRIYTGLMGPMFLIIFFDQELSAFRTIDGQRLIVGNKITFRIPGTPVEFLPAALVFSCHNIPGTTWPGALGKRYGLCVFALRETGTGKKIPKAP